MNRKVEFSVYGYVRQNFEQKCIIHEIIATIIQFFKNKGGYLYVCGDGRKGKLGIKKFYDTECMEPRHVETVKEIFDISVYNDHTMFVDFEGGIWAVGCGEHGALGTGNAMNVIVPKKINLNNRAIAVSVGYEHSLILVENGNVLSCGRSDVGQLGHGDTDNQSVPKVIAALKGHKIIQISAGHQHSGALSENDDLFMWGWTANGQCGAGRNKGTHVKTPTMIKLNEKVNVIESSFSHSLLITNKYLLYSFGSGSHGQLGHGTKGDKYIPTLIESIKDVKIVNVAGGYIHSLCIDDEFNIWAFGRNNFGQCGQARNIRYLPTPNMIEYFKEKTIRAKKVAAGEFSSCVITQNNECFVFGKNNKNQLGLKKKKSYFDPTKLPLSVQKASMGRYHSAFIGSV